MTHQPSQYRTAVSLAILLMFMGCQSSLPTSTQPAKPSMVILHGNLGQLATALPQAAQQLGWSLEVPIRPQDSRITAKGRLPDGRHFTIEAQQTTQSHQLTFKIRVGYFGHKAAQEQYLQTLAIILKRK